MNPSDAHDGVLGMADEVFGKVIEAIENGFTNQSAAFYYDNQSDAHIIDMFRAEGTGLEDDEEFEHARAVARDLDQMAVFAFTGAPDDIARGWGEEHGEGLGEKAVERSKLMTETMPSTARAWSFRQSGPGRILGDLHGVVVFAGSQGLCAQIRLDSFLPSGPRATPTGSSRQFLEAMVTKNDLHYLAEQLKHLAKLLPKSDDDLGGEAT